MSQQAKFVDLTRTYLPIDPASLPETLSAPESDYAPEKRIPVMPYEGHNFMPTAGGYRSYFGTNAKVALAALGASADYVFIYQRQDYTNFFVALCDDGIWTNNGLLQPVDEVPAIPAVPAIPQVGYEFLYVLKIDGSILQDPDTYAAIPLLGGDLVFEVDGITPIYRQFSNTTLILDVAGNPIQLTDGSPLPDPSYTPEVPEVPEVPAVPAVLGEEWSHAITLPLSTEEDYLAWTFCTIGTTVYLYRQGASCYWRIQPDAATVLTIPYAAYALTPIVPSFLNMPAQLGIFKAGGRLGFWDSDNAIAWSAFEDLADFTPAIKTQANITKFVDVVGRITTVKQHGDGFIVYATKSIVYVSKDLSNTFLWKTEVLSTNAGVAYAKQVAVANPDVIHFALTSSSLIQVTGGKAEAIGVELFDFLKESPSPTLLSVIAGRYLFLETLSSEFLAGQVSVYSQDFPATEQVLSVFRPARTVWIDGFVVPGAQWTIPGYPGVTGQAGVDDIPAQAEIPGFPAIPGVDTIPAIPAKLVAEMFNTIRDAANLGKVASPWYQLSGKVWPEYPVGYINCYQKGVFDVVAGTWVLPFFTFTSTSNTQIDGALLNMEQTLANLYSGAGLFNFKWIPNLPFFNATLYTVEGLQDIVDTTGQFIVGAAPSSPSSNQVAGLSLAVTPPDDLFGRALTAWSLERDWMKTFVGGLKKRVYEHTPITETLTGDIPYDVTGTKHLIYGEDIFKSGGPFGINYSDTIATFYIPTGVHPEEYSLINSVYHMYQEVAYYEKHELIRNASYSPVTIVSYSVSSHLDIVEASIAAVLSSVSVYTASPPCHLGPLYEAFGGAEFTAYTRNVLDANNTYLGILIVNGSYTREVSYSWRTTQVFTPDCKLQYHAYIPPVWYTFNTSNEVVPLESQPALTNPDYYCHWSPSSPAPSPSSRRVLLSGRPIPSLLSPLGTYAGGVRYTLVDGVPAVLGYGGFGEISGVATQAGVLGYAPIPYIPGGPPISGGLSALTIDGFRYTISPAFPSEVLHFPGGSFLLQQGSSQPAYPLLLGAFVFDLQYKRWGKMQTEYKHLLDFTPLNTLSSGLIPSTSFGVEAAALKADGFLYSFDAAPSSSELKWGKVGITRLGETSLEEVTAQFRLSSTGTLSTETSLDGKYIAAELSWSVSFTNTKLVTLKKGTVGKWHNLILSGQWDVVYLEYTAFAQGRR